jgi:hypothetical protein
VVRSPVGVVSFTVTPGTTPPFESTTSPEIDPEVKVSCANAAVPARPMHRTKNNFKTFVIVCCPFLILEKCRWVTFLTMFFFGFAALKIPRLTVVKTV